MPTAPSDRIAELLAGAAAGDLAAEEREELARATADPAECDELLRAAALAQLAFLLADRKDRLGISPALQKRLKLRAGSWIGPR